jgi:hypothetical protein
VLNVLNNNFFFPKHAFIKKNLHLKSQVGLKGCLERAMVHTTMFKERFNSRFKVDHDSPQVHSELKRDIKLEAHNFKPIKKG